MLQSFFQCGKQRNYVNNYFRVLKHNENTTNLLLGRTAYLVVWFEKKDLEILVIKTEVVADFMSDQYRCKWSVDAQ